MCWRKLNRFPKGKPASPVKDAREKAEIMANALGCIPADINNLNYSHKAVHIYSQVRNIHSTAEAKVSTAESLNITPEDLAISDNVNVEWILVAKLHAQ